MLFRLIYVEYKQFFGCSLYVQVIVKQVLGMLKAIAGNDNVKVAIVNAGGIGNILGAVNKHIKQPQVSAQDTVGTKN